MTTIQLSPDDHACDALPAPVIASGASNTLSKVQCGVASCTTADVRLVVPCAQCQGRFCLVHRHADQHACVPIGADADPNAKARALLQKHFPGSSMSSAAAPVATTTTSTTTAPRPAPNKKMPILELMKLKQKAQGDAKLPSAQRSYHAVHLPGGTVAVRYFTKSASVGRVLDTVFALTGMDWKQTVATHDVMLSAEDVRLPTNAVWSDVVADGATVVLDVVPKSNAS
ncbi:AN1-type zinc finger protein 1 [Allomyces javanicus]|nr:AN1-type zinc finger protein 1 [Allomyces javanicus]